MVSISGARGNSPISATPPSRQAVGDKTFAELIEKTGDEIRFFQREEFEKYWNQESAAIAKVMVGLAKEAQKNRSDRPSWG